MPANWGILQWRRELDPDRMSELSETDRVTGIHRGCPAMLFGAKVAFNAGTRGDVGSVEKKIVYVVDDDDAVRDSARWSLKIMGYEVETFDSANAFLDRLDDLAPGCVIFDINMPGLSGLEAQRLLKERGSAFPVIILTGQGDIGKAVQAMKDGAVEFIEKPYANETMLNALDAGFGQLGVRLSESAANERASTVVGRLSPRERQVLQGMLTGLPNKLIGHELGLSTRTVEVYRSKVMDKLEVRSLSSAVKLALAAGLPELETS